MKLIAHLKAIEQFVLDHKPPYEIRTHLDVLQEHLEAEDSLLDRIAEKDVQISKVSAEKEAIAGELDKLQHPPLEAVAIKLLKHFAHCDRVLTLEEIVGTFGCSKGEAHRLCDTLSSFDPPLIQPDSIPIDDQRLQGIGNGDMFCYSITPEGRKYAKNMAS